MTKQELKDIIKECFIEEGIIAESVVDDYDVELESAEFIMESCFKAIEEGGDSADGIGNFTDWMRSLKPEISKKASELYSKAIMKFNGDMDAAEAEVRKQIQEEYVDKINKHAKLTDNKVAMGVIIALVGAAITAGIVIAKKNAKAKKDEKKEK